MLNLFPNRTRRDLKLKFKKEEKNNSQLIDKALLKFNTFDIEELQRELDKEDEERRKEAENGSTEVKELVKRKILKKQEAKARAQQQIKSRVEKILENGDEAIRAVDRGACASVTATVHIKENFEEKEKKPVKRRALKPNVGNIAKRRNVKTSEDSSEVAIIKLESRDFKQETVDIIQQTIEDESASDWSQSNVIDDVPQYPLIDMTPMQLMNPTTAKIESLHRPVIEESNQMPYEDQPLSPMQLIQEQVHYEISQIQAEHESAIEDEYTPIEQSPLPPAIEAVEYSQTTPTDHATDLPFDEESFLNSLNLEQLSIVVRQIDGKDYYDIHETDPVTELISDKPLNIPQHVKDILISALTQED
jgi:transcription factor TFIIIB component B''